MALIAGQDRTERIFNEDNLTIFLVRHVAREVSLTPSNRLVHALFIPGRLYLNIATVNAVSSLRLTDVGMSGGKRTLQVPRNLYRR